MTNNKIVYSLKVVRQLLELGFIPIKTAPNPIKPEFNCWIFERTKEFDVALGEILGGLRNER